MAHANLILQDEHGFGAGEIFSLAWLFITSGWRRGMAGEKNAKRCPLAGLALGADPAATLPNDSVARGQSEPAAVCFFRREKRLEEVRLDFLAHSRPGIGDGNDHIFAGRKIGRGG